MKHWTLLAYDVRDAGRLRKTAKLLEGYGTRIQYSIFRCRLTPRELERLQWELSQILEQEDGLLILPLCAPCVEGIRVRGSHATWAREDSGHVIVG
jgi:CRISPR-associated protein Cas2